MKRTNKVTILAISALLVTVCSLIMSFNSLDISNSLKGVASPIKNIKNISLDNVSSIISNNENALLVIKEPKINDNIINYSVELNQVNSYAQFQFDICNNGSVDSKISDIKITDLKDMNQYVDITLEGLKIGDVVKAKSVLENIKVISKYRNQFLDENNIEQNVVLDNVKIEIFFE